MPVDTVCRFVRPGSLKAAKLLLFSSHHTNEHKTWSQVLLPVPLSKGLRIALIVETSNDESPTQNEYRKSLCAIHTGRHTAIRIHYRLSINTLRGVPVALFLTNCSSLRSSYSVKTTASRKRLCPSCHPHPIRSTLRQSIRVGTSAKVRK